MSIKHLLVLSVMLIAIVVARPATTLEKELEKKLLFDGSNVHRFETLEEFKNTIALNSFFSLVFFYTDHHEKSFQLSKLVEQVSIDYKGKTLSTHLIDSFSSRFCQILCNKL
jgi:hypothetical protein